MESREKPLDAEASAALPESPKERKVLPGEPGQQGDEALARRRVVVGKRSAPMVETAEGLRPLSVIGDDERSRILATELTPYRMICALKIKAPWGGFIGTGWFVDRRTIITAGHCVYDRSQMGGWADEIEVTPAQDANERPFGTFTATRFFTVDEWLERRDPDFDIGAIRLDEPVDARIGAFSVAALPDADLQDCLVNVSGYPGSPGGGGQQWWAMNRIKAVTPRRIFYDVDTSGGQSGGPVYIYEEDDPDTPKVIGIHAYGIGGTPTSLRPLVVNSAPRLIPEVIEQIEAWRNAPDTGLATRRGKSASAGARGELEQTGDLHSNSEPGVDKTVLRTMIYEGLGGRRFTQASPILPDVWIAYGTNPRAPQELLIAPHRDGRAEATARQIRSALRASRDDSSNRFSLQFGSRGSAQIACIPGLVAARLHLDEMLRVVLPETAWWRSHRVLLQNSELGAADRGGPVELPTLLNRIGSAIDALRRSGGQAGGAGDVSPDFLWLVWLVGTIVRSLRFRDYAGCSGIKLAEAFASVLGDHLEAALHDDDLPPEIRGDSNPGLVWTVTLNRRMEAATLESARAIKADAARHLFNISCRKITWAVIDTGIDSRHPAFWDWSDPAPPTAKNGHPAVKPSRVDRTYDFTTVRDFLQPSFIDGLIAAKIRTEEQEELLMRLRQNLRNGGEGDPDAAAPARVAQLRDRLNAGLEIDWELLEPMLRVPDPQAPGKGHGTHVAGVLAADWRVPKPAASNGLAEDSEGRAAVEAYQVHMQGVCPDIRLFDMRVLSNDGGANEFEVICALQFIAHLNRRTDTRLISGANLSFSTAHNVENHACGSTPICETCDRLWGSGVVLVAAAGNNGHKYYQLAGGDNLGGYHSISITDPGNAQGVITVGATHFKAHQYGVSYFSSRGPTGDGRLKPDLVAPGEKISGPMPHNTEGSDSGTSYAAPHVSGAAALLMARFEELHGQPERIRQILCDTATDLKRERYFQGAGMVDILRALQSI